MPETKPRHRVYSQPTQAERDAVDTFIDHAYEHNKRACLGSGCGLRDVSEREHAVHVMALLEQPMTRTDADQARAIEDAKIAARIEVKQAVEEWFSNVSLDDLFDVKHWFRPALVDCIAAKGCVRDTAAECESTACNAHMDSTPDTTPTTNVHQHDHAYDEMCTSACPVYRRAFSSGGDGKVEAAE